MESLINAIQNNRLSETDKSYVISLIMATHKPSNVAPTPKAEE